MSEITTITDEQVFQQYASMRNAPRDTLVYGVYPNCDKADAQYESLVLALGGGNETTPDLSAYAAYHAQITASVAPFIAAIQSGMSVIHDSMHITNVLAQMTNQPKGFAIEDDAITLQDYMTTLQAAIATLTATIQTVEQLGGGQ